VRKRLATYIKGLEKAYREEYRGDAARVWDRIRFGGSDSGTLFFHPGRRYVLGPNEY
jgi:hypothetical protein